MHEASSFTYLGRYENFGILKNTVAQFTENDWLAFNARKQTMSIAGGHTDTIPLIYGTADSVLAQQRHAHFDKFSDVINEVCALYKASYSDCVAVRAFFARMAPMGVIKSHKDKGVVSAKTHRIHLPITTNPECLFTVGNETINMKEGELWIIDNTDKYHSVTNGSEYRIHLIIDVGNAP